MPFSVFSHLVEIERQRPRLNRSLSGFSTPAVGEMQLRPDEPVPMVSLMRGTFAMTHKSSDHVVRYGFTPCPAHEEGVLTTELARVLWELAPTHGWPRCTSVSEAVASFLQQGLDARTLVVSSAVARTVLGRENDVPEGLAGTVGRLQVLVTGLPENVSLVALAPARAGYGVRTGDNIGLVIRPAAFRVVET